MFFALWSIVLWIMAFFPRTGIMLNRRLNLTLLGDSKWFQGVHVIREFLCVSALSAAFYYFLPGHQFQQWGPKKGHPLVNIQKAIEIGPFIVDLPIKNGDFQLLFWHNQRLPASNHEPLCSCRCQRCLDEPVVVSPRFLAPKVERDGHGWLMHGW